MQRGIKYLLTFGALLSLTSCRSSIANDMAGYMQIIIGIAVGMAVLGGVVCMFHSDYGTRAMGGAVGITSILVSLLLIILLIA